MSVYVDDTFDQLPVPARWRGGGHLQADSLDELHAFAASIGLRREWFQTAPGRPDKDHYDLTASKRDLAIEHGAIAEGAEEGSARRRRLRQERRVGSRRRRPGDLCSSGRECPDDANGSDDGGRNGS